MQTIVSMQADARRKRPVPIGSNVCALWRRRVPRVRFPIVCRTDHDFAYVPIARIASYRPAGKCLTFPPPRSEGLRHPAYFHPKTLARKGLFCRARERLHRSGLFWQRINTTHLQRCQKQYAGDWRFRRNADGFRTVKTSSRALGFSCHFRFFPQRSLWCSPTSRLIIGAGFRWDRRMQRYGASNSLRPARSVEIKIKFDRTLATQIVYCRWNKKCTQNRGNSVRRMKHFIKTWNIETFSNTNINNGSLSIISYIILKFLF